MSFLQIQWFSELPDKQRPVCPVSVTICSCVDSLCWWNYKRKQKYNRKMKWLHLRSLSGLQPSVGKGDCSAAVHVDDEPYGRSNVLQGDEDACVCVCILGVCQNCQAVISRLIHRPYPLPSLHLPAASLSLSTLYCLPLCLLCTPTLSLQLVWYFWITAPFVSLQSIPPFSTCAKPSPPPPILLRSFLPSP